MKKLAVLSPHLDDAVLGCGDHIFDWKKKKKGIRVVTIFTRFGSNNTINSIKNRLAETGFTSAQGQERLRKKEDQKAMEKLGITWQHLDFVDCSFRIHNNTAIYPNRESPFSGVISSYDSSLTKKLETKLRRFKNFNKIAVPLAVGGNVDHVIVRKTAEKLFSPEKILYYIDYPYALILRNWTLENFFKLILKRKSIKPMSDEKRDMMNLYKSQIPLLFKSKPVYPEIILSSLAGK